MLAPRKTTLPRLLVILKSSFRRSRTASATWKLKDSTNAWPVGQTATAMLVVIWRDSEFEVQRKLHANGANSFQPVPFDLNAMAMMMIMMVRIVS